VLIRYAGGFTGVAKGIRNATLSLDHDVFVDVIRLGDNLEKWRAPSRIVAGLSGALGALALLLASIGVYGMVSYSVSRFTPRAAVSKDQPTARVALEST
jgi:hypothetical protein